MRGLAERLGAGVLVAGSGFEVGIGKAVEAGLEKKFGTVGCAGVGTAVDDVSVGVWKERRFLGGSLASIVVVASVVGLGCEGAGADKTGVIVLVVEVADVGPGVGRGGFVSSSFAFLVS